MTELPVLYRAAICTSLEDHGVEQVRVEKDGQITEILPMEEPLWEQKRTLLSATDTENVFLVQAVVEADVIVGLLTGETLTRGKALLKAMGVEGWQMLYDQRRKIAIEHGISSIVLRDTLTHARTMMGTARRMLKTR